MKIIFSPSYCSKSYISLDERNLALGSQVVNVQGLLSQLALHAGLHQEIPPYTKRLASYYSAIKEFDKKKPDNIFHSSFAIDGMSVAKTLLGWRDTLALAGWSADSHVVGSRRLEDLVQIDQEYNDDSLAVLLHRLTEAIAGMKDDKSVPSAYKSLVIDIPCPKEMLPDYILPLLSMLESKVEGINYGVVNEDEYPSNMRVIEFTEQYKAEAWLSQQEEKAYQVWINSDNKRLDNWLHMSGKKVAGSDLVNSNPQIVQMFLIAVLLFQRPLNVNTLLQYLYLPECPLPWELTSRLSSMIVREGGFGAEKVLKCINDYLDREMKAEGDETPCRIEKEDRHNLYDMYLPFDLRDEKESEQLSLESDIVDVDRFCQFLMSLKGYASSRAVKIASVMPHDIRIVQLHEVAMLIDALLDIIGDRKDNITFTAILQWAQSLYDTQSFRQYNAQIGSRNVIGSPAGIVTKVARTIWCDFYGDVVSTLSTDFLSPYEQKLLIDAGVKLWNPEKEASYQNFMVNIPLHQTTDVLTFVVCKKQGATILPTHPLRLQLPDSIEIINGDEEFAKLPAIPVEHVDNHRPEDEVEITFDAQKHPFVWRNQESYSALKDLLQNPLDYFMNYVLGFSDKGPTEIQIAPTRGNVAHEVIETLFMAEKDHSKIIDYVKSSYDKVFNEALVKTGALLLLPENHLECDKLRHQLRRCVIQFAEIIKANHLTVIECEKEQVQSLGFSHGVLIKGYLDMYLKDADGNDVIFDLKWTSKKDFYQDLIKKNRAMQLAIYKAMLNQHQDHPEAPRTAFFVMPLGELVSSDEFDSMHYVKVEPKDSSDLVDQMRKGYDVRRELISSGHIETSELMPVADLAYEKREGVLPLETVNKTLSGTKGKKTAVKTENEYSNYKVFTL